MYKEQFAVSEITVNYRPLLKPSQRMKIGCSKDIFEVINTFLFIEDQGHFESSYIILLDNGCKVLGVKRLSDGGLTGCLMDPKIIFQTALKANAAAFAIWHNHPSGTMRPSQADINVTKKIKKGAEILDLTFVDHLIIDCEGNYYSFADTGNL